MFHKIDQWLEVITEKMVLWISDESSVTEEQLIIRKFALERGCIFFWGEVEVPECLRKELEDRQEQE